ncbi:HipA family kinase [Paenibacillus thermotolerans]|uniref:HipA family kinase n=1 Tax=Paenibacillus thermotolerans TaxID=3027807 RepID=UPI002368B321|nr:MULTISPECIES: HipA family kinase [unclassified Paenibacillus]
MRSALVPVQYAGAAEKGYSKPQLIRLSDGLTYVVKFKNNPTGTRVLVNEYVAGKLARLLALPVPPFRIVPISNDFIEQNPELAAFRFAPGMQFASLFIEGAANLRDAYACPGGLRIVNRGELAGVVLFDLWLSNTDRKENNVLLAQAGDSNVSGQALGCGGQRGCRLFMIDHGRCFASHDWTVDSLSQAKPVLYLKVHRWCLAQLRDREELDAAMACIRSLPEKRMRDIVSSIPRDWEVTKREREALLAYLVEAQDRLPAVLEQFIEEAETGSA